MHPPRPLHDQRRQLATRLEHARLDGVYRNANSASSELVLMNGEDSRRFTTKCSAHYSDWTYQLAMKRRRDDRALGTLMQAAQGGDTEAYVLLLKEITPRVRQIVRGQRRFLKIEDIEDLVQDILLSLHAVRATYDPRRPFMPWLMAITRHRLADAARRYTRRAAHEVQVENLPVTFSDEGSNIDSDGYRDPQALRQAIEDLSPAQRAAIEMLKLREMSLKEAAAAKGTSIGALKVSVHRAMATLRKVLIKDS